MVKKTVFIFVVVFSFVAVSQEMRIGLFRKSKIAKVEMIVEKGVYEIFNDTAIICRLQEGEKVLLSYLSANVQVTKSGVIQGVASSFRIVPLMQNSVMELAPIQPALKKRHYNDGFEVSLEATSLKLINVVDMNNYLSGVIESEGGGGRHMEYYKVQALMSRTYALKNIQRHKKEGFQLCDGVHCQAYHSKLKHTPTIQQAVEATSGEVLVDAKNELVTSYFSANCGGQTCDAAYVWNTSVPYLESFVDTFCIHTRQATWEKRIKKSEWDAYLNKEFGLDKLGYELGDLKYNFTSDQRKAFYIHPSLGIPLRDLRQKFNLKSTFFSTRLEGVEVVISGRGFGHGVGLCQEGAMQMAFNGYTYQQIALFYFSNVEVIDYFRGNFFNQSIDQEQGL